AHGFLSLSLLSAMTFETMPPLENSKMGVNHGFDSLRFLAPVKTGARIRTRFVLADVKVRPSGWVQTAHDVTIEIEGSKKPALTARWLTLTLIERQPETA
ncbi:MAG: MaoC family dehydratase, partial [Mesorhizobium sp.]